MSDALLNPNALVAPRREVLADFVPAVPTTLVRDIGLIAGGAALTGVSAQFAFVTPLSPVPFTLSTLTVLVVGAALGTKRAVLSMLVYLGLGVVGLPWFAEAGSGWHMPSFGYIIGFVVAAGVVGALAKRGADRKVASTVALLVAGTLIVYTIGTTWLAFDLGVSAGKAFSLGVQPFLITDSLKIVVAALAFPAAWRFANKPQSSPQS
ncbi:MAG TPA: biotin transporter BioY [Acidimicrobiales bacterium]|nr:biotin transporter BioY [Acidimicrobiales bacterium]